MLISSIRLVCKREKKRERGRLGLCVCQTKKSHAMLGTTASSLYVHNCYSFYVCQP